MIHTHEATWPVHDDSLRLSEIRTLLADELCTMIIDEAECVPMGDTAWSLEDRDDATVVVARTPVRSLEPDRADLPVCRANTDAVAHRNFVNGRALAETSKMVGAQNRARVAEALAEHPRADDRTLARIVGLSAEVVGRHRRAMSIPVRVAA